MRGYHIRIRVTVQPAPTVAKNPAKATPWTADTFVPKSIFENLPSHTPRKTSKKTAILGSKRRDYRHGPIRIDWLDLGSSSTGEPIGRPRGSVGGNTMDNAPATSFGGSGKERDTRSRGREKQIGIL